jgi:predicted lipoprotein with Yx(FWY)xxD motif
VNRALAFFCLLVVAAIGIAGCGGSDGSTTAEGPEETGAQKTTSTVSSEPHRPKKGSWGAVYGAENDKGILLFDLSGHTLYRFTKDKGSVSTCYGACAKAWPPALTEDHIRAVDVPRKLVDTSKRKDGTLQLTYDGHPLYTHRGERSGRTTAIGVEAFGGRWYALRRSGKDVTG